jgi:RNA polymerase sigma-70 factor (ECF subfamily)
MLNYNYLQEIINGCIENDRKCQEILYKMYYTKFKNIIRNHIKDQGKLEEILNDGFLRIFKKIHIYENAGSFDGWMLKIIKHSMFDYIKKYKKHTAVCFAEIDTPEHKVTSDKLHFKKLIDLIEELPNNTKNVFNMHYFNDLTHREIAVLLDITESTSKWHFANAKELLKNKINKIGLFL